MYLARRLPYVWDNARGSTSLSDVALQANRFFQARNAAGQASQIDTELDAILADVKDKTLESFDVKLYVEQADPALDKYVTDKLQRAGNRDVHDVSKRTTLPIAREIVQTYVMDDVKLPWYIDLLNINLNNTDLNESKRRIRMLADAFCKDGTRITENLDFAAVSA